MHRQVPGGNEEANTEAAKDATEEHDQIRASLKEVEEHEASEEQHDAGSDRQRHLSWLLAEGTFL